MTQTNHSKEELAGKKVAELQTIAGELGVSQKGLKKAELIEAIIKQPRANGAAGGASTTGAVATSATATPAAPAPAQASPAPAAQAQTRAPSSTAPVETEPRRDFNGPFRERGDRDRDRGRRRRGRDRGRGDRGERGQDNRSEGRPREFEPVDESELEAVIGVLDILPEGYGFLRTSGYLPGQEDVWVAVSQVRRFQLRRGDQIQGMARRPRESEKEKYRAMVRIEQVNGKTPEELQGRPWFERLTPLYPEDRIRLELEDDPGGITQRIIDLVAPIGKGQRGMIVSPPKAGKTTVMKQIANSIRKNAPECKLIVLLVDERPEEVTDMQRSVDGEIIYSTFDRPSDDHIQVTELTLDRAKRMVELGEDVVIMLDGITRLSRAYNLATPASGRILSGGVDSTALYPPKRFFGAARNIEHGGSLTILATALVDTGSRMDEVIFEEFKGTGNWELRLDRRASEKRIFPAIDIDASGTRKEELLLEKEELAAVWKLRNVLHALEGLQGLELLIDKMRHTKGNAQFLAEVGKRPTG
ncbi:MAG: transcription termination factor Rho [Actinomycetota bacterium]|nr:transcription termination factor Rho [Actinomycetota bacterium]